MSLLLSATPSVFVDDSIYGRIQLDDQYYDDDLSWFVTGLNVQQELIGEDYLQPIFIDDDNQQYDDLVWFVIGVNNQQVLADEEAALAQQVFFYEEWGYDDLDWLPIFNNWQNEVIESTQTQVISWLLQVGLYDARDFDYFGLYIVGINGFQRDSVLPPSPVFSKLPRLPIDPYYPNNGDLYSLRRRYFENHRQISIQLNLIKDRLDTLYSGDIIGMNISPFMPINTDYPQQRIVMYDIYRMVSGRINLMVDIIKGLGDTTTSHLALDPYYPVSSVYAQIRVRMYDIYRNEIIMINKISDYVDFLLGY